MNCRKSPVNNGLPVEFYKKLWNVIKPHITDVIKYILEREISPSQQSGVIKA